MLHYDKYYNNKKEWVVFIHGIGGNNKTWDNQIEDFSKEFNLILIELPAHGRSKNIDYKIDKDKICEAIKEVLDYEKIESANFVALSLGTIVFSHFVVKYPMCVKSVVLTGAAINMNWFCKTCLAIAYPFLHILPYKMLYNIIVFIVAPHKKYKSARRLFIDEFDTMERKRIIEWVKFVALVIKAKQTVFKMKKCDKNILFISGGGDFLFVDGARYTAKKLNKNIVILKNRCHVCNLDGYEDFNKYSMNFIKENGLP